MGVERSTLFKLYYMCLVVIVIAGLGLHFMEAAESEGAAVHNGHEAEVEEAATHNGHGEAAEEAGEELGHFWWLDIPLFAAGFAFVGGVLLLALSKLGAYPLLKREEDYYEQHSFKEAEEEEGGEQ